MDNLCFDPPNIMLLVLVALIVYLFARQRCKKPVSYKVYVILVVWAVVAWSVWVYYPQFAWYAVFVPPLVCVAYMLYAGLNFDQFLDWLDSLGQGNGNGNGVPDEEGGPLPPLPPMAPMPVPQPQLPMLPLQPPPTQPLYPPMQPVRPPMRPQFPPMYPERPVQLPAGVLNLRR